MQLIQNLFLAILCFVVFCKAYRILISNMPASFCISSLLSSDMSTIPPNPHAHTHNYTFQQRFTCLPLQCGCQCCCSAPVSVSGLRCGFGLPFDCPSSHMSVSYCYFELLSCFCGLILPQLQLQQQQQQCSSAVPLATQCNVFRLLTAVSAAATVTRETTTTTGRGTLHVLMHAMHTYTYTHTSIDAFAVRFL